jgi:hypothetical protein
LPDPLMSLLELFPDAEGKFLSKWCRPYLPASIL